MHEDRPWGPQGRLQYAVLKASRDVHVLIPGTYKYAILHNERDFPDGTNAGFKIERLSWIIWAQSNHTNHYKQRTFSSSSRGDVAEGKVREV